MIRLTTLFLLALAFTASGQIRKVEITDKYLINAVDSFRLHHGYTTTRGVIMVEFFNSNVDGFNNVLQGADTVSVHPPPEISFTQNTRCVLRITFENNLETIKYFAPTTYFERGDDLVLVTTGFEHYYKSSTIDKQLIKLLQTKLPTDNLEHSGGPSWWFKIDDSGPKLVSRTKGR